MVPFDPRVWQLGLQAASNCGARAGGLWGPRSAPRRRTCGRPVGDPRGARPCPSRYNPGWCAAGAGCCDLLPLATGKRVRQAPSAHALGTAAAAASAAVTAPLGSRVAASASVGSRSAAAAVACATTGYCTGTDARGAAEQRRGCTRHGRRGVSPPRRRVGARGTRRRLCRQRRVALPQRPCDDAMAIRAGVDSPRFHGVGPHVSG